MARRFWSDQSGQDMVEYTLLMAFIAIACLALLVQGRPGITGIWETNTNRLSEASEAIAGS